MNQTADGMQHATAATPPPDPDQREAKQREADSVRARQRWMAVLARASREELETILGMLPPQPAWQWLRRPETGLAMLQGRAGGSGERFNLGEASITRCTLRTAAARTGVACVLGRDHRQAELAALLDALLQGGESVRLERAIEELAASQSARRELAARKTAATRVDFYTLVRGESA